MCWEFTFLRAQRGTLRKVEIHSSSQGPRNSLEDTREVWAVEEQKTWKIMFFLIHGRFGAVDGNLIFCGFFLWKMGSGSKDKEGNPVQKPIIESNAPAFFSQSGGIYAFKTYTSYAHASHQDDGCMSKTNSLKLIIIIIKYQSSIINHHLPLSPSTPPHPPSPYPALTLTFTFTITITFTFYFYLNP